MKKVSIESASNPLLKRIRSLKTRSGRKKNVEFLLEGPKIIKEALLSGYRLKAILCSKSSAMGEEIPVHIEELLAEAAVSTEHCKALDIHIIEDRLFGELCDTVTHQSIIATASFENLALDDTIPVNPGKTGKNFLSVLCCEIQDPGNLGTILRTARGLGLTGAVLSKGTVDPYSPKVVRAASGAHLSLKISFDHEMTEIIDHCHRNRIQMVYLSANAEKSIEEIDWCRPSCLVLGNEGRGFRDMNDKQADSQWARIAMENGCESLNVAVAGAIAMYEASRKHSHQSEN